MTNDIFIYFLLIINGYVLGLLPFEFIALKITTPDKESAINLQEIAVFALAFLKGFLAVFIASLFNVPLQIMALCGIATIIGHSWSPFFDFKDTRGFPVLLGTLLPMYFPLVLIMLLVCVIFSILWTMPVAVIISVLLGVTMSFASIDLWNVFLLLVFALFIFVIKRLFPLSDLLPLERKRELIENRIFFANDSVPKFRKKTKQEKKEEVMVIEPAPIKKQKSKKVTPKKLSKKAKELKKATKTKAVTVKKEKEAIKKKSLKKTDKAKAPKKPIKKVSSKKTKGKK